MAIQLGRLLGKLGFQKMPTKNRRHSWQNSDLGITVYYDKSDRFSMIEYYIGLDPLRYQIKCCVPLKGRIQRFPQFGAWRKHKPEQMEEFAQLLPLLVEAVKNGKASGFYDAWAMTKMLG